MDALDKVMGSGSSGQAAPRGKRALADLFDLVVIPVILGVVAGLLLLNANELIRGVVMVALNIGWLVFRDTVYAPGRAIVGIKIVSLTGPKVTVLQALIRNVLLMIPVVLLIGYIVETIAVFSKDSRVMDGPAKTRVVG